MSGSDAVACQDCGRWFDSSRGRAIHRSRHCPMMTYDSPSATPVRSSSSSKKKSASQRGGGGGSDVKKTVPISPYPPMSAANFQMMSPSMASYAPIASPVGGNGQNNKNNKPNSTKKSTPKKPAAKSPGKSPSGALKKQGSSGSVAGKKSPKTTAATPKKTPSKSPKQASEVKRRRSTPAKARQSTGASAADLASALVDAPAAEGSALTQLSLGAVLGFLCAVSVEFLAPTTMQAMLLAVLLASMPAIYVGGALQTGQPSLLAREILVSVPFYVLAVQGLAHKDFFMLGLGILLHALTDSFHLCCSWSAAKGRVAPKWYSALCGGFDLAVGLMVLRHFVEA